MLVNNAAILYDTWQRATTADLAQVHEALETNTASVVWAATLPDDRPTGGCFRDGRPVAW